MFDAFIIQVFAPDCKAFWQKDAGRGGNGGAAEWYMMKENKRKGAVQKAFAGAAFPVKQQNFT